MEATEAITLVAMILVTGGVVSWIFQLLKKYLPASDVLRVVLVWALCIVVALAEAWLAGDVMGLVGSWREGTLTAQQIFSWGSGLFAAATAIYNAYYKGVRPMIDRTRESR